MLVLANLPNYVCSGRPGGTYLFHVFLGAQGKGSIRYEYGGTRWFCCTLSLMMVEWNEHDFLKLDLLDGDGEYA